MNTAQLARSAADVDIEHGHCGVYTVNDSGTLVAVKNVKVVVMRDTEGDTPILVLER